MVREVARPHQTYSRKKAMDLEIYQEIFGISKDKKVESKRSKRKPGLDIELLEKRQNKNKKNDKIQSSVQPYTNPTDSSFSKEENDDDDDELTDFSKTTEPKTKRKPAQKKNKNPPEAFRNVETFKQINSSVLFETPTNMLDANEILRPLDDSEIDLLFRLDLSSVEAISSFASKLCRNMKYKPSADTEKILKEACSTMLKIGKRWENKIQTKASLLEDEKANFQDECDRDGLNDTFSFEIPPILDTIEPTIAANVNDLFNFENGRPTVIKQEKLAARHSGSLEIISVKKSDGDASFLNQESTPSSVITTVKDRLEVLKQNTKNLKNYLNEYDQKLTEQITLLLHQENKIREEWTREKENFTSKAMKTITKLSQRSTQHTNETNLHHLTSWEFLRAEEEIMKEGMKQDCFTDNETPGSMIKPTPRNEMSDVFAKKDELGSMSKVLANNNSFWSDNSNYLWSKDRLSFDNRLSSFRK